MLILPAETILNVLDRPSLDCFVQLLMRGYELKCYCLIEFPVILLQFNKRKTFSKKIAELGMPNKGWKQDAGIQRSTLRHP